MVVLERNIKGFGNGVQLKPVKIRQKKPGNGNRVQHRGVKGQFQFLCEMAYKSHIEACIVGYKDRIPHKLQKLRQNHVDFWVWKHHGIVDACQLLYVKGNGHVRIHKGGEFVRNPAVYHLHGANLNNFVLFRAEACCLDIEHNKGVPKILAPGILYQLFGIVHQVSLHPVEDFKGIPLVQGVVGIREGLDAAMVRYSHSGHAPLLGPLDDAFYLGYAVHIAHLCMAVQLHALFQAGVHALAGKIIRLLDSHDGAKGQLAVKLVNGGDSLYLDKHARIDGGFHLIKYLRTDKHFNRNGIRKIRYIKGEDELAASKLPVLAGQHLAS